MLVQERVDKIGENAYMISIRILDTFKNVGVELSNESTLLIWQYILYSLR